MFIEPNSHIKIYRGIESSSTRRPIFKTATAQTNYFNAHLAFDYTPTTHVKYTMNRVRVGLTVAQLLGCNYLSFVNPNFGNKTYYAAIVGDPIYINNEVTELTYAVDYFQTDMFNVTLEPCYNDREHLTDEDYTKSVADPFDSSIAEFWTSEALASDKDLEDNYDIMPYEQGQCFYAAESLVGVDSNNPVLVLAIPHLTPPNADEELWYDTWRTHIINADEYGGWRIQGHPWVLSTYTVNNLFNGIDPIYASKIQPSYDIFVCALSGNIADNPILGTDGLIEHLTLWNVVDQILGLHQITLYMFAAMFVVTSSGGSQTRDYINVNLPNVASYHNKKLARYPYSYIRVETPAGDTKEYQYERFDLHNASLETDGTAQFDVNFDYNCQPELSLIPMWYKRADIQTAIGSGPFNYAERVAFQAVPQLPFATDSFIAGIAASNADILSNRTITAQNQVTHTLNQLDYAKTDLDIAEIRSGQQTIKEEKELMGTAFGAAVTAPTIIGGIVGAGAVANKQMSNYVAQTERNNNLTRQADMIGFNRNNANLQRDMMQEASNLSLAQIESSAIYKNFQDTKPAYVCDKYVPGSGTGLAYYNRHAFIDFIITRVKLRDAILQKYDQYFSNYGYNSGRYGAPRIAAYLSNAATGKPHFAPSGSHNVTYVKTTNAAVKAPSKTSEQFWETMLNAGCQFIRGEDLITA